MDFVTQLRNYCRKSFAVFSGWTALFAACVLVYLPGLEGPFLLDDFGSIAPLGNLGGVTDWTTFKAFVLGGHAGPTGRPLALLTFLIDANDWPADPWLFKRTNLIIHLITGALLGVLITKILHVLTYDKQRARWIALVSTAIWLLHPFLVSTTLYAVQRMAQMSTLFIAMGLIGHLYGRSLIPRNESRAYLIMSSSLGVFTFLAMMSKENGILLPLLIGVLEMTVLASQQERVSALNRYWVWVFIFAPTLVIFLYLGERVFRPNFFDVIPPRDFSIYERALTQPRILFDYLQNWFIPKLYTTGIFQDHFEKSTGIFSPITTLASLLLHLLIISLSLIKRRKWPLFSLAVLFFYTSHLLESSVINLELYFEHRNYLATFFLFVPLVSLLKNAVNRRVFAAVSLGAILIFAGFTRYSSTIWADYTSMVEAAARKVPTSARAQGQYAADLYNAQRYDESLMVIERAMVTIPNNSFVLLTHVNILCKLGILNDSDIERAGTVISAKPFDPRSLEIFSTLTTSVVEGECPSASMDGLRLMYTNMLQVPENADPHSLRYSQVKYLIGFIDVSAGRPSQAVAAFEASLQARPGAGHAMSMAALLATNGNHKEALHLSDLALLQMETSTDNALGVSRVRMSDIMEFRETVRTDMNAALPAGQANQ